MTLAAGHGDASCLLGFAYELGRNAKASERNERRAIAKQNQQSGA